MDAGAEWSQPVRDRLDPVRLLDPQLTRAGDTCLAARVGGQERDERQLVDECRHLRGFDLGRNELSGLHLD